MPISVIMTCHNEARYITQAVESVFSQTAADAILEVLVVNDGSKDDSAEKLAQLQARFPKLRVMERGGIGPSAARNIAIAQTHGDLIAVLDGDDYWLPEKISRQLPVFDDPRVGLCYTDFVDFTQDDAADALFVSVRRFTADQEDTLETYFVHDGPVIPSTAIIRRAVFDDVGLLDEDLRVGEDTDICLRIAERWRFQHVPGALTFKRRHPHNLTRRLDALLPVAVKLTEKFSSRNPCLKPLSGRRMARRLARAGNDCAQHGELGLGARHLLGAIRHDPLFWRPYVYLTLLPVPKHWSGRVRKTLKKLFHRAREHKAVARPDPMAAS
jgi:glycosyltransferase involved in cell wall biosynthesis